MVEARLGLVRFLQAAEIWLAVGLWVSNEVVLQPLSQAQPACRLSLGQLQPRSLAVCRLGGEALLVVGTSSGEVLWWRLLPQQDASTTAAQVHLQPAGTARVGLAAVSLHDLTPPLAGLLAVSDQTLLIVPGELPHQPLLRRVHGGDGLAAACSLAAASAPGSRLAYVRGGLLHVGCLEAEQRLRWDELVLPGSATPGLMAFDPATGSAAVACTQPHEPSLRLVDVAAMKEAGCVPLPPRHSVTAVASLHLPCSSCMHQQQAGLDAGRAGHPGQEGCAPFLLVALAPEDPSPASIQAQAPVGQQAMLAGASEFWWRQDVSQPALSTQQQQQSGRQPRLQQGILPGPSPGLLLVYRVQRRAGGPAGASAGGGSPGVEHLLHGACPVPAAAFSLAAVHAEAKALHTPTARMPGDMLPASAPASDQPPSRPLLVAGCDDGVVRLFR
jgi:hypothetical protein